MPREHMNTNYFIKFKGEEFAEAVKEAAKASALSHNQALRKAGISSAMWYSIVKDGRVRQIEAIYSVAAVLGLDVESYLVRNQNGKAPSPPLHKTTSEIPAPFRNGVGAVGVCGTVQP